MFPASYIVSHFCHGHKVLPVERTIWREENFLRFSFLFPSLSHSLPGSISTLLSCAHFVPDFFSAHSHHHCWSGPHAKQLRANPYVYAFCARGECFALAWRRRAEWKPGRKKNGPRMGPSISERLKMKSARSTQAKITQSWLKAWLTRWNDCTRAHTRTLRIVIVSMFSNEQCSLRH